MIVRIASHTPLLSIAPPLQAIPNLLHATGWLNNVLNQSTQRISSIRSVLLLILHWLSLYHAQYAAQAVSQNQSALGRDWLEWVDPLLIAR